MEYIKNRDGGQQTNIDPTNSGTGNQQNASSTKIRRNIGLLLTIGSMGRLTDAKIDCLQNYYGLAIRQNTRSVVDTQHEIMASLYHVASTDEEPNHDIIDMCLSGDDSRRRYATDTSFKHKHGLPESVPELLEPIYDALSTPELLGKCYQGKTQNDNECQNKLISGGAAVKSSLLLHWSFKMLFVVLFPTSMMETFLCFYCIYLLTIWTIK